ncbi:MAG: hypothetical protein ACTSU4_15250 [Promethearchaeota archaeon]
MPIRIPWTSKESREYLGIALMLLGLCGLIQVFIIFIAQYFLSIGNYLVVILVPIGVSVALFYSSLIIFESFAQVERRKKLKDRYRTERRSGTFAMKLLFYPITRPLLVLLSIFLPTFFITHAICILFLDNVFSFVIAENLSAITCLLLANLLEKSYAKVKRV